MNHLAHLDQRARSALDRAVATLTERYGSDLIAVILYGSAAGSEYLPGRSDLNVLILLTRIRVAALEVARELAPRWRRDRIVPLLLTAPDIHASLDVFPIELSEIKASSVVLFGQDPFGAVSVQRADLRVQCEHELKRHLLNFRRAYLDLGRGRDETRRLLIRSITGLLPLFRTLIRLTTEVNNPKNADVIVRVAEKTGIDPAPFAHALGLKAEPRGASTKAVRQWTDAYLVELERLIDVVDRLKADPSWP